MSTIGCCIQLLHLVRLGLRQLDAGLNLAQVLLDGEFNALLLQLGYHGNVQVLPINWR